MQTKILLAILVATLISSGLNCGDDTGACYGSGGVYGNNYCYSDFTEDECSDYDGQEVNSADWKFHEGDTCADQGCPSEGSC